MELTPRYLSNTEHHPVVNVLPNIAVLDMDGTLYKHGPRQEMTGHIPLVRHVLAATLSFIQEQERKLPAGHMRPSEAVLESSFHADCGLSQALSHRYNLPRAEVFNATWGIVPVDAIVQADEEILVTFRELRMRMREVILLTAAPSVWMKKVLSTLSLSQADFDRVVTAERFTKKEEIFALIAEEREPSYVYSVGDCQENDIQPAARRGMKVYHVTPETPFPGCLSIFSPDHP